MKTSIEIEEFLTFLVTEKGNDIKTMNAYKFDLYSFCDFISDKDVSLLTVNDYNDFIFSLQDKGYKKSSLIRKSIAIKGFYKFLKNEGLNDVILFDLQSPKNDKRLPVVLTIDEVESIFKVIETDQRGMLDKTIIFLLFTCGLRVSELVSLKKDTINVKKGYLKVLGKRNKERIVPLSKEAITALNDYQNNYLKNIKTKSKNLFIHKDGSEISRQYVFLRIKKYAKEANIKKEVSPHTLRHTYATLLLENDAPLRMVQELLGHKEIATTQIYTHISNKKKKEEYEHAMRRK